MKLFEPQTTFDQLPRSLKEKIFSYFEEKEYAQLKEISKGWKKLIEEAKSRELKLMNQNIKFKSERYKDGKHFLKDYEVATILLSKSQFNVGLACCYGRVFSLIQLSLRWFCLCKIKFHIYRKKKKKEKRKKKFGKFQKS